MLYLQLAIIVSIIFVYITIHMKLNDIKEKLDALEYIIDKVIETDKKLK
jgi:hypothetical protein